MDILLNIVNTSGLALLAFILAFYGLIAKEKKTPYMVRAVYGMILLLLLTLFLSILAHLSSLIPKLYVLAEDLTICALGFLIYALVSLIYRIARERNRHLFFRDDIFLFSPFWASIPDRLRSKPRYEHDAMEVPGGLIDSLKQCPAFPSEQLARAIKHYEDFNKDLSMSAVLEINSVMETDDVLTDIAARFLEHQCYVQYTSCNRHPIEFLSRLISHWKAQGKDWKLAEQRVILVDGYTPHFGFADSIYHKWTNEAEKNCIACIQSKPSYAGIHTAIARAFNKIKEVSKKAQAGNHVRQPALLIYEGCQALIDLESPEQYRLFVRHVLPSERLWGGMFTIFVESSISEDNQAVLRSSADIFHKHTRPD